MFKVRNGIIFRIIATPDGYDIYRTFDDNLSFDLIDEGVATIQEVREIIEEESQNA